MLSKDFVGENTPHWRRGEDAAPLIRGIATKEQEYLDGYCD
jgi:hypothetical protein